MKYCIESLSVPSLMHDDHRHEDKKDEYNSDDIHEGKSDTNYISFCNGGEK